MPATENAWHGVPPTSRLGAGIAPVKTLAGSSVMSPWFGTSGNRCASTAEGNGSISENHVGVQPSGCTATDTDSMPLHTDP